MIHSGVPRNSGNEQPASQSDAVQNKEGKMRLENRLRIKKLEIKEDERRLHDMEREIAHLESEIDHARQQVGRVGAEVRSFVMDIKKEEDLTKGAGEGIREKDEELRAKREKEKKIEHEITLLKQQIEVKEHALGLIHDEERNLVKEKEGYRRQYEMEHFGAKAGGEHAHEKELEVGRYKREEERKTQELAHKKTEHDRAKQGIMFKEGEIATIESDLRRLG